MRNYGSAPIRAGVIGHPISHSKSPLIHGYWLKRYGINGEYLRYDIAPETFKQDLSRLVDEGVRGFNVTIPYKEAVLALCSEISPEAEKIGAVNTVVVRGDGSLFGTNTDGFGFIENIRNTKPDFVFSNSPALVIGAGGAARSIIYSLLRQGCPEIFICNRTLERAEALAREFGVRCVDWSLRNSLVRNVDLLVNTTSLGMVGQPTLEIELDQASKDLLVSDIVYVPLKTDLLRNAQEQGLNIVTGIGMLLHQARPGFEAWFGVCPEVTKDIEALLLS